MTWWATSLGCCESAPRSRASSESRRTESCSIQGSTWPRPQPSRSSCLRRLPELDDLGRPLLLAISRKDFVGALTGRPPRDRGAGTLGAVEPALDAAAVVLRVHDVAATADFLAVRAALRGEAEPPAGALADELRREALA